MLFFRSLVFNIAWYVNLLGQMILYAPIYFFLPHHHAQKIPRWWANSSHFLHKWLAGTDMQVTGLENVPEGGCIIASKHQSIWEFYALYALMPDPVFVLKAELMKIPLFGWYVAKVNQIPIRRGERSRALRHMLDKAREALQDDRQILIFPEGTRRRPGDEPAYKYGVTRMYMELGVPVVPVALNSGLYWPRRSFLRHPGTIRISLMEPILPGLSAEEFAAELQHRIETECDELYRLAAMDDVSPPLTDDVRRAIDRAQSKREAEPLAP